ncbi:MAG: hypothetical protein ACPGNV_05130 [Mangrovicoccus sp.]
MKYQHAPPKHKRLPELFAYVVSDASGQGDPATWTKIGAAGSHKDGMGYTVRLEAFPADRRLTLRFRDLSGGPDILDDSDPRLSPSGPR